MATYLGNSDSQQTSSNNSFSCRPNDNNQESNRSNSNTDDTLYYSCESSTLFLRLLEDAIACMPHSEKEAYLMANDAVPELIQQESNPIDLICFEHFNIWDACQRLMNYWKWKQYLFQDRVYHSIYDLSGNGALDDMDLQRLSTGYGTLLPNDTNGNAVFLIDRTRLEQIGENYDETLDPIRNLRLAFYFAALAALEQKKLFPSSIMVTPANGATILSESSPLSSSSSSCCYYTSSCSRRSLVVLNLIRTLPTFKQPATLLTAVMRDTSAVRLKQPFCIFMIKKEMQQQEDQARNSGFVTTTMKRKERQPNFHNVVNNYNDDNSSILALFLQTIIPTVDRNLRSLFPGLTLALCYNAKDALQKLQNYGFQSYGLPSSLGGSWLYDTFICWIQQQGQYQKQQREEEMSVMREIGLDEDEENNYCEKGHQQRDSSFADSTSQQLQHQVDSLSQQHQQNIIEIDILYDNFFQYNLSDIHLTANHFATFYEIRQKLFGNRASLPFDQTGCK